MSNPQLVVEPSAVESLRSITSSRLLWPDSRISVAADTGFAHPKTLHLGIGVVQ
jgi:hypothetical protein